MASRRLPPKKKSTGLSLNFYLIIVGAIGIVLSTYVAYRASLSGIRLFSVSMLAMLAGLLFESFRISDSRKTVFLIFIGTYLFSLISFLPGKHEYEYNFDNHARMWPYFFIIIFSIWFGTFHKDRVTAKLNEVLTLILSLSLIYWVVDYGLVNYFNGVSIFLITIASLFSLFSIVHAVTHTRLSRTVRLTLSVWSTIILFAFAIDNILKVFRNPDMESSKHLSDGLSIGIQYFLLGVSALYIMRNYMLLAAFMPGKNDDDKKELKKNKQEHLDRYSDQQANRMHAYFCILFAGIIFGLNYKYKVLPRHTAIWLVFFISPLILKVLEFLNERNGKDAS